MKGSYMKRIIEALFAPINNESCKNMVAESFGLPGPSKVSLGGLKDISIVRRPAEYSRSRCFD